MPYSPPASLPPIQVLGAVVALLFFVAFNWFFKKSRMGVAMRAVADNPVLAGIKGVNAHAVARLVSFLAMGMAGIGGMLIGLAQHDAYHNGQLAVLRQALG